MKELSRRWHAPTPRFWRTLQKRAAAAASTVLLAQAIPHMNTAAHTVLGVFAGLLYGAAAIAQLACDDDTSTTTASAER
jgi:hypothetical protein